MQNIKVSIRVKRTQIKFPRAFICLLRDSKIFNLKIQRLAAIMIRRCKRNSSQLSGGRSKIQRTAVSVMTSPITSNSDKKSYRLIKLENGLKALLIHHEFEVHEHEEDEAKMSTSESETEHTESEDEEEEHEREKLAAVALCVGAGSFQDHEFGIEGLAHFVGKLNLYDFEQF